MRKLARSAILLSALLASAGCNGTEGDNSSTGANTAGGDLPAAGEAVPSCYAAVRIGVPAPAPTRSVFVLVDQTTGLDDRLRETARRNLAALLRPGTRYTIATFSAFSRGHYATILTSGTIEAPLTTDQRLNLSSPRVAELAGCLDQQRTFAARLAAEKLAEATAASSSSFANSEIMSSLRQLSDAVRASPGDDKIVIVISDLLEHSAATSFYSNRDLRLLDPAEEIGRAEQHTLFGDFGEARLAVIGAGLLSPGSGSDAVRETPKLNALRAFWQQWFERSNARLIAYGQPDLVTPIG